MHVELLVNVGNMAAQGSWADIKIFFNLFVKKTFGKLVQNFLFPRIELRALVRIRTEAWLALCAWRGGSHDRRLRPRVVVVKVVDVWFGKATILHCEKNRPSKEETWCESDRYVCR